MAPSQEYLDLLASATDFFLKPNDVHEAALWIMQDWEDIKERPDDTQCFLYLADAAFDYLYAATYKPIETLIEDMRSLHVRKNAGYTGSNPDPWWNFRQCEVFGITTLQGVLTRLSDKISRFQMLQQNAKNEQVGESILDTVQDIASYALIAVCLIREKR